MKAAVFLLMVMGFVSCSKNEEITLSLDHLWFPNQTSVQEIEVKANCSWSITKDDDADWYVIEPMSGRHSSISVTVQGLGELDERTSSFTITSAKGKVQLQVQVSQNTDEPLELKSLVNKIFGVSFFAHWNVDYYDEVIEESYRSFEFNPFDTTGGIQMYFLEDGNGVQRDNQRDSAVYYPFTYDYNPYTRILHLDFEVIGDTTEIYDAPVLVATDELFRFLHEYNYKQWELADMTLIGTFQPQEKARIMQFEKQKKKPGAIFQSR